MRKKYFIFVFLVDRLTAGQAKVQLSHSILAGFQFISPTQVAINLISDPSLFKKIFRLADAKKYIAPQSGVRGHFFSTGYRK